MIKFNVIYQGVSLLECMIKFSGWLGNDFHLRHVPYFMLCDFIKPMKNIYRVLLYVNAYYNNKAL